MMEVIRQMWPLLLMLAVVLVLAKIVLPWLKRRLRQTPADRYERCEFLMSPAERSFFGVLEGVVSPQFRLFAKVRLADVVKVKGGMNRSEWQSAFNSISAKHLDFVACDPGDLSIQFAIELDDSSHERQSRRERDVFVDDALKQAGIPLFRFSAMRNYSPDQIRAQLSPPDEGATPAQLK